MKPTLPPRASAHWESYRDPVISIRAGWPLLPRPGPSVLGAAQVGLELLAVHGDAHPSAQGPGRPPPLGLGGSRDRAGGPRGLLCPTRSPQRSATSRGREAAGGLPARPGTFLEKGTHVTQSGPLALAFKAWRPSHHIRGRTALGASNGGQRVTPGVSGDGFILLL